MSTTLNRNYSKNVLQLTQSETCAICGHAISYASKTFFEKENKYIGLDCWEKEKEIRRLEREKLFEIKKQKQREIDLQSVHFSEIGKRIKVKAKLERSFWIYTSTFGYSTQEIYLNVFRTEDGNLVCYKGANLISRYLTACFPEPIQLAEKEFGCKQSAYSVINKLNRNEMIEKFKAEEMLNFLNNNIKYISASQEDNGYKEAITIVKDGIYVTLSGTVKENKVYDGINQTIIQRPNFKNGNN